ncbi:hypothetical protein [Acetobacter sp.]|uniref:hypothetical protein n=1 Tax=Acetobacter sp. TaxID=440 RepID=UPI0025B922F6|nr:hypothetical protein [Acetobacter sp.]MCH4089728.1 hypothetical protein [Acetobacter sp.]MCI1298424.1 hypothetical protein [Acetobacter sp.]MCI1316379.1 hypothetical protein [Acetobacter sp.]
MSRQTVTSKVSQRLRVDFRKAVVGVLACFLAAGSVDEASARSPYTHQTNLPQKNSIFYDPSPDVSNPGMYGEGQEIIPLYQSIPGFLQSPYGPPSFGPPYGTSHLFGDWGVCSRGFRSVVFTLP